MESEGFAILGLDEGLFVTITQLALVENKATLRIVDRVEDPLEVVDDAIPTQSGSVVTSI